MYASALGYSRRNLFGSLKKKQRSWQSPIKADNDGFRLSIVYYDTANRKKTKLKKIIERIGPEQGSLLDLLTDDIRPTNLATVLLPEGEQIIPRIMACRNWL